VKRALHIAAALAVLSFAAAARAAAPESNVPVGDSAAPKVAVAKADVEGDGPAREPVDVVEHLGERIPGDLRFTDAYQNQITFKEALRGKPVVLTLVYFDCPALCSTVLNGLVRGLSATDLRLGDDYTALTVSFNPKDSPRESAVQQNGYLRPLRNAEKAHAQDWLFLTAAQDQIKALAAAVGFQYRWDAPSGQFEHPAVIMVLTPDGRLSRYLYGVSFPERDLKLAVLEASGGRVGTSFDRVLLKCFKYDPASRKYHLYVFTFVRAGAFLVFLGLATMLTVLWRRDLQKGKSA
jgi:protein SCO1